MIVCTGNYLKDETTTITPADGNNLFPAANLYSGTLHGEDGVTAYTGSIVIDLGSAKQVTCLAVLRSSASVTVEANSSDVWTSPPFSQIMDEDLKIIDETYRYWRITTAAVGLQYIGYFYLGIPIQADYAIAGSVPSVNTQDTEQTTTTGRHFTTKGIEKFTQSFTVNSATESEYEKWYDFYVSAERAEPVVFAQYEQTQCDLYPVYFAVIKFSTGGRSRLNYRFNFNLMEVT